ncbi:MAG TPA: carboxypeptidase-like regulatory domain-containing protein, partial [Bryobacteraceae bacterium]|nr:carboxypeptidase-like regulatory domain-containing protein [Bryobacteraceae bacterium]
MVCTAVRGSILVWMLALAASIAQAAVTISGKVVDENGAPVQGARVVVLPQGTDKPPATAGVTSDAAGLFRVDVAAPGVYQVQAEHDGFFLFSNPGLNLDPDSPLEIHINHLKELAESVDVRYSPPVIDPAQTSDTKQLHSPDILNVPYPASQDYRSALPL